MWPASLQMSREECRAILRRLELETYSHVISVFRAQGGLSEEKAKLLAELRTLFHITQDRHRAESRRVSNDEELCTIAEVISGPNTWQDWAREGRRQFPMLPRVAAQTALAFVANKLADETAKENAKLPYPADTANAQLEQELEMQAQNAAINKHKLRLMPNIVMEDPFKMPDIPAVTKKNLKRNLTEHQVVSGVLNKRIKNESQKQLNKSFELQQQPQQQQLQMQMQQQQVNMHSNSHNNNHVVLSNNKLTTFEQKQLEGRRFFYTQQLKNKNNKVNVVNKKQQQQQQQQLHVKSAISKKNLNKKLQKSLKSQQKLEQNKQKQIERWEQLQIQQQQQQQQQMQHLNNNNVINMNEISQQQQQQLQPLQVHMTEQTSPILQQQNLITLSPVRQQQQQPQVLHQGHISMARKDLAKHFAKLASPNALATNNNNTLIPATMLRTAQLLSPTMTPVTTTTTTTTGTAAAVSEMMTVTSPTPKMVEQKQLLSTPVQKYIVEDRLPPTVAHAQVLSLPMSPQTSNKLRTINTTILPPGTKLQPAVAKKIIPLTAAVGELQTTTITTTKQTQQPQQQQQLFNIISSNESSSNLTLPTHAPPAIINLHGVSSNSVSQLSEVLSVSSASGAQISSQSYGKVLTTKLMPVLFNNANKTTASNIGTSCTTTLIQTSAGTSATVSPNATFIKTLPQGVLISGTGAKTVAVSGANAGNTYISTLASGTQLFRKPNILARKGTTTTTTTQAANKVIKRPNLIEINGAGVGLSNIRHNLSYF